MIHFTKGDMFDLDVDIRINTVNCVGVMGAGVALAFKTRYPEMFLAYQSACTSGEVKPGQINIWRTGSEWILNFPTKRHWREKSRYEDISSGLEALHKYLKDFDGIRVALPALGCGNGGLDWTRVAPMIEEKLKDLAAEIYVFEPADSLRLGKRKGERSKGEVMQDLEILGFRAFDLTSELSPEVNLRAQVKGNAELLASRWIALFTSREIRERESSALTSIAKQLGTESNPPTIAMVYQNSGSEEIAEIFLDNGLAVILILPFSPRVKKRIGLTDENSRKITYAILSFSDSVEVKGSQLDKSADDVLRYGASALLFSDPEPSRHFRRKIDKRGDRPCFYLRYASQSVETFDWLEKSGFKSIGRSADTGAPNLGPVLSHYDAVILSNGVQDDVSTLDVKISSNQLRKLAELMDSCLDEGERINLSLSLELLPLEMKELAREILHEEIHGADKSNLSSNPALH